MMCMLIGNIIYETGLGQMGGLIPRPILRF